MPNYVLPQVLVFQEFEAAPAAALQPLRACIVGEHFDLHRYDVADEKSAIRVSDVYDPDNEQCFAWPARLPGGVVDETYTKVFFDNALLKYFHDPSGDGSVITHIAPSKNRIRAQSKIFQTANGFTRSTGLLRDVKIGDAIKILASACDAPVTFRSSVVGLLADTLAAIVDAATSDVDNQGTLVAATSSSQTEGVLNMVEISAVNGTLYDGFDEGNPTETYTVEVIGASASEDATTAILKVTSASGNDNQAAVTPAAFGSPTAIGTRGLTVTFVNTGVDEASSGVDPNDFQIGQKFVINVTQAFVPGVPTSGGTYGGEADTTYIVTVSRGGKYASAVDPQITVSTTTGIDLSGPTTVTAAATAVPIGTQGATIEFSGLALNKGDRYYVGVTASKPGAVRTLVLANNLPAALRGECDVSSSSSSSSSSSAAPGAPDLDVTLYIKKNIEVTEDRTGFAPLVNWTQDETEICLQAGVLSYDESWALNGVLQPLPVEDGKIYVHHRDRLNTHCNVVSTISDISEIPARVGVIHPDNPLAFGLFKTMENSAGTEVKFISVCSHSPVTLEDWLAVLDQLVGRDDVYSLVPLTQNKDVLDAFKAHCVAQSTPENGRWRICWLNMAAQEVLPIYTVSALDASEPVLATITDDLDTAGTQHTILEATGEEFSTRGVRAGDTVRAIYTSDGFGNFSYDEFIVDAVINEETLRLFAGPAAAVNVPSKIEVHRTLTKTELSENLALNPGLFADRRARLVWPDQVGNAGLTFPGYFLCAALAGLRSSVLPHQGLTNIELTGFDDLSRTVDFFSASQLNTLAASGYWIVTQDPSDGTIFSRHQLTTGDQDDLNFKEDSITTNIDSISYLYLNRMKQYIGKGNVTPAMINIIRGEILAISKLLVNSITVNRLGPQLIDSRILELAPHATLRDRIVARIDITPPFPLNNLELHLIA